MNRYSRFTATANRDHAGYKHYRTGTHPTIAPADTVTRLRSLMPKTGYHAAGQRDRSRPYRTSGDYGLPAELALDRRFPGQRIDRRRGQSVGANGFRRDTPNAPWPRHSPAGAGDDQTTSGPRYAHATLLSRVYVRGQAIVAKIDRPWIHWGLSCRYLVRASSSEEPVRLHRV